MNFYRKSEIPSELHQYFEPVEIGLEPTPDEYVAALVEVFREVRRVLRDDGTVWLNLGDSYASSGDKTTGQDYGASKTSTLTTGTRQFRRELNREASGGNNRRRFDFGSLKPKDLIGIPWRVAFALQADGWYLRQDIIWHKPNPMPESVTDRCTKAHEYVFLLSKSARYYYDAEAVKEGVSESFIQRWGTDKPARKNPSPQGLKAGAVNGESCFGSPDGKRNRRSVWTIATQPYSGAHFATFPPKLIEPCILAGSKPGDTVLDPFGGSGTTAGVALEHGREAILCELSEKYAALIPDRINSITDALVQARLFD